MKRAQTLIFVIFLLAIFGILSGALGVIWQAELQSRSSERDSSIAYYLAQLGIERAKVEARANPGLTGWSGWQVLGAGRYRFFIQDVGGNQRLLQSVGQRLDVSGNTIAERQIEVTIRGIGTPPTVDDAQVAWTWRHI